MGASPSEVVPDASFSVSYLPPEAVAGATTAFTDMPPKRCVVSSPIQPSKSRRMPALERDIVADGRESQEHVPVRILDDGGRRRRRRRKNNEDEKDEDEKDTTTGPASTTSTSNTYTSTASTSNASTSTTIPEREQVEKQNILNFVPRRVGNFGWN